MDAEIVVVSGVVLSIENVFGDKEYPEPYEFITSIFISPISPGVPGLLAFVLMEAVITIGIFGVLFNVYKPELVFI